MKPQPRIDEHGVPWCDYDSCGLYDGKHCVLLGYRPDYTCVPAVRAMAAELAGKNLVIGELRKDLTRHSLHRAHGTIKDGVMYLVDYSAEAIARRNSGDHSDDSGPQGKEER